MVQTYFKRFCTHNDGKCTSTKQICPGVKRKLIDIFA